MKKYSAWIFILSLLIIAHSVYAIVIPSGNKEIGLNSSNPYIYNLDLHLDPEVSSSATKGTVIGHLTGSVNEFKFFDTFSTRNVWVLQVFPNSTNSVMYEVCNSNIPGIGIKYYDEDGNVIPCAHWGSFATINCPRPDNSGVTCSYGELLTPVKFATKVADLVVTGEQLPPPGYYPLNLPMDFIAHWPGATNSSFWGGSHVSGSEVVKIVSRDPYISFPDYPTRDPVVNLNLTYLNPGVKTSIITGQSNINLCLYDGHDGTSKSLTILLHDENLRGTGKLFSVYHDGSDKNKDENRIDYEVSIASPVTHLLQQAINNIPLVWTGTNHKSRQHGININGVSTWCSPSRLVLTTKRFSAASKVAGNYSGVLSIILNVNSSDN